MDTVVVWTVVAWGTGLGHHCIVRADVASWTHVTLANVGGADVGDDIAWGALLGGEGTWGQTGESLLKHVKRKEQIQ